MAAGRLRDPRRAARTRRSSPRTGPGCSATSPGSWHLHGIGVLQARIHSESGMALEVFVLDLPSMPTPVGNESWATSKERSKGALTSAKCWRAGRLHAGRAGSCLCRALRRGCSVDNEAATSATVMEVRAPDPGAAPHGDCRHLGAGPDIISARVATLGNAVPSTPFMSDSAGQGPTGERTDDGSVQASRTRWKAPAPSGGTCNKPKHNGRDPETTALYGLEKPTAGLVARRDYLLLRRAFAFISALARLPHSGAPSVLQTRRGWTLATTPGS